MKMKLLPFFAKNFKIFASWRHFVQSNTHTHTRTHMHVHSHGPGYQQNYRAAITRHSIF